MRAVDDDYRAASATLDERPDPRVRAAVLAAATRAVDARPRDATAPFRPRRRVWSIAAVLVVSVMTGLVAMQASRERPDLVEGRVAANADAPAPPVVAMTSPPSAPTVPQPSTDDRSASEPRRATAPDTTRRPDAPRRPARVTVPPPRSAPVPAQPFPDLATASPAPADKASTQHATSSSADAAPAAAPPPATRASGQLAAAPFVANESTARAKSAGASAEVADDEADPARWAARIAAWRTAGRDDEADRELARLRARYPSFTVPRDALRVDGTR